MYLFFKKMTIICFCLMASLSFAQTNKRYVIFEYNFHSITPLMTNKQCEEHFKSPLFYQIENDHVIYEQNPGFTVSDYQRTNVTHLDKDTFLFTGKSTYTFDLNGKKQVAKEESAFVLKIKEQVIRGSFIIEGFCKGNLIGVEESVHQWPAQIS